MGNEIILLKCSGRILNKYRKYIKDNQKDSDELIEKKLFRNFLVGEEKWREDNIVCRCYGKMEILVDIESMRIINIHNNISSRKFYYIDFLYKRKLDKMLDIPRKEVV